MDPAWKRHRERCAPRNCGRWPPIGAPPAGYGSAAPRAGMAVSSECKVPEDGAIMMLNRTAHWFVSDVSRDRENPRHGMVLCRLRASPASSRYAEVGVAAAHRRGMVGRAECPRVRQRLQTRLTPDGCDVVTSQAQHLSFVVSTGAWRVRLSLILLRAEGGGGF